MNALGPIQLLRLLKHMRQSSNLTLCNSFLPQPGQPVLSVTFMGSLFK